MGEPSIFQPPQHPKDAARMGEQVCKSAEAFKAWSQNVGHDQVLTTFMSYGVVPTERQGEIIRGLGAPQLPAYSTADDIVEAAFGKFQSGARLPTAL